MERLPTLVKSMRQKKPTQVKYGKSCQNARVPEKEGAKYHLAWVSYAPGSGKYNNATYSQRRLKLRTQPEGPPVGFPVPRARIKLVACCPAPKAYRWRLQGDGGHRGHGDHPHHLLVSGPGGWLLGLGDDHRRGGRLSHKALPCPFLGVTS